MPAPGGSDASVPTLAGMRSMTARRADSVPPAEECHVADTPMIAAVDCFHVLLPARETFMLAGGAFARSGEPSPRVLVRVRDADGAVGWGEATPCPTWTYETAESIVSAVRRYLAPVVVGRCAWDLREIHRAMDRAIAAGWSKGQPLAKAAIDVATHDLLGRRAGVPIHRLLGGRRVPEITLGYLVTAADPERAGEIAARGLAAGYEAFKVKVGIHGLAGDLAMVRAVRAAIGPDRFLWVDANQGYTPDEAIRQARALKDYGVAVFEQPVPADAISALVRILAASPVPVALDESLRDPAEVYELARLGALGGVILKVQRTGGLFPSAAMAAVAEAARLPLLGSGLCETDIGLAASLHLFGAAGVTVPVDLNGRQFVESPFAQGLRVEAGGRVRVPDAPGLGIDIDGAWIEAHATEP